MKPQPFSVGVFPFPVAPAWIVEFAREHGRVTIGEAIKLTGISRSDPRFAPRREPDPRRPSRREPRLRLPRNCASACSPMQSRVAFHEVVSRFTHGDCSYKVRSGVRQEATDATHRYLDDTQMTPEDKLADAAESRDEAPPIRGHRVTSMAGCR